MSRPLATFIALISFAATCGCEPLRPEVVEAPTGSDGVPLAPALRLIAEGASKPSITQALRSVVLSDAPEDDIDEARRLLAVQRVKWFQMAHIARDALTDVGGHERAFNRLVSDVRGQAPGPMAGASGPLQAFRALLSQDGDPTRMIDARRALDDWLVQVERGEDPEGREIAIAGRRLLGLDVSWRYGPGRAPVAARVSEVLDFLKREDAEPFVDNAWLMLRLGFAQALVEHVVPRRPVLDAAAMLLGVETKAATPPERLLALGEAPGPTWPEALYGSLRALRRKLAERLDRMESVPEDAEGRKLFATLATTLGLDREAPERPAIELLYALGEGNRASAVGRWLRAVEAPPIHDRRALLVVERAARARAGADDRFEPILVMTILTVEEAVARRLGDSVRGRAVRLMNQGRFVDRTLVLPGGVLERAFPQRVADCLRQTGARCLERLTASLVRKARRARQQRGR